MSHTAQLLQASSAGEVVVCSMAPYVNWEVTYAPRYPRDPEPWTVAGYRYSGRECHAMTRADLVAWVADMAREGQR
jgi:hypothetical protein